MDHYAPHTGVAFEGYFNKFILPSGATLVIIVCSVHNAEKRPHLVSVTYSPISNDPIYQQELYPDSIEHVSRPTNQGFDLQVPGVGEITVGPDSSTKYRFKCPIIEFEALKTDHIPWSSTDSTPESWLVYLPLPLHWHVHTLGSPVQFKLSLPEDAHQANVDFEGTAVVHQEKNWAKSFPSAHMWLQAYKQSSKQAICLAGGQILGMEAYLVGYRGDHGLEIDFRPPFALKVFGWSPFMSTVPDWDNRKFTFSVQTFTHKLSIKASVDDKHRDRFVGVSAPFADGHRPNSLAENFRATIEVQVSRKSWWSWNWQLVAEDRFNNAALEFGADYYPLRGQGSKNL